jgi:hypothetical protein
MPKKIQALNQLKRLLAKCETGTHANANYAIEVSAQAEPHAGSRAVHPPE